jgi:hypothetical protein
MTPAELLDEIDYAGGTITVRVDRSLDCQNIPPSLRDELVRHQFVITAILLGECEPHSSAAAGITPPGAKTQVAKSARATAATNTRKVKKLIADAQAAGVTFERTYALGPGGAGFFNAFFPNDETRAAFAPDLLEQATRIYQLLFPPSRQTQPRRKKCEICKGGSGCRKRGASGMSYLVRIAVILAEAITSACARNCAISAIRLPS